MPELPEMETYKKLLDFKLTGKTITNIEVNREKSVNMPGADFAGELEGVGITAIERRAKHLIFRLSSGKCLLLHLMLGGWMYIGNDDDNPKRTKQVILSIGEQKLYFIGLRLGYLHLLDLKALKKAMSDIGPEPLEASFTRNTFLDLVHRKRGMLKTTLVNQQFIAGIGNCYSDEICFEAMLKPERTMDSLNEEEIAVVYEAIHAVLNNAISHGGYMDNPLFSGDTLTGSYNKRMLVYDRGGEHCRRCGGTILEVELSSRKSFYCPDCQS